MHLGSRSLRLRASLKIFVLAAISMTLWQTSFGRFAQGQTASETKDASSGQASVNQSGQDPSAAQILMNTLDAMGGNNIWSAVHGIGVSGTLGTSQNAQTRTFQWTGDWSTGRMRVLQGDAGASVSLASAGGSTKVQQVTIGRDSVTVPQLDVIATLAKYSPAASIMLTLQSTKYSVEIDSARSTSQLNCIVVFSNRAGTRERPLLRWYISRPSGLPAYAEIAVPDAITPGRQNWDTATYKEFNQNGRQSSPSSILLRKNQGPPTLLQLNSIQINPVIPVQAVTGGNQ